MTRTMLTTLSLSILLLSTLTGCTTIIINDSDPRPVWRMLANAEVRDVAAPEEGAGGFGGSGSSSTTAAATTSTTTTTTAAGGAPECQTCALALMIINPAPAPCPGAPAGMYAALDACACQGSCGGKCASTWCSDHVWANASADCEACLLDQIHGCGVEHSQCIEGVLHEQCSGDSACSLGFSCVAGDPDHYLPARCSPHLTSCSATEVKCEQPQCSEVGRWAVTPGIATDIRSSQHLLYQRVLLPKDNNAPVPGGQVKGFAAAKAYCDKMVIEGVAGWRLPSYIELQVLTLNPPPPGLPSPYPAQYCSPALDQAAFPNTLQPDLNTPGGFYFGEYWTSTTYGTGHVGVSANHGSKVDQPLSSTDGWAYVRCVHDPLW